MKYLSSLFLIFVLFCAPVGVFADESVDINSADSEILVDQLVGVGPQKAMAIIQYRQANGPFNRIEDLANVKGIGMKLVEQNRSRLVAIPANSRIPAARTQK